MSQERIQQINEEIVRLEKRKGEGVSMQGQEQIDAQIKGLEMERAELEAEQQAEQNEAIKQDHVARVTIVASQFDDFLEQMNLGGMTLRQVIGGISEYQLVSIELKKAFTAQAERFSEQYSELQASQNDKDRGFQERETQLQRQNEILQGKNTAQAAEIEETNRLLHQERLERANAEQTRDNAVAQLDEANKQIAQLNGHVDDLRNEIALGTRAAISVVDTAEETAQKNALAEQIRKERTIYDVQWVDEIKRTKKKAKLAATGEEIEFPWTVEGKYFVIQENEVNSFREQYAIQTPVEIPNVAETPIQDSAETVEVPTFPISSPTDVQGVSNPMAESAPSDIGTSGETPVTRSELERRLAQHKAEIIAEIQGAS